MKIFKFIILLFVMVVLSSCEDNSISFGTVEYYPSFLWVESNVTPVDKTFHFDFSQDAQNDSKSFAQFQFVDNNGNPISTSVMQVYVDGSQLPGNRFSVYSKDKSKNLTFKFSPNANNGKYQGYLKLIGHNLDRIESQQLSKGQKVDVFQWTLYYDKVMNPLAKILMWIGIVVGACISLWILLLRQIVYPRFRAINKMIVIPNQAPVPIRFKGARMVILDSVHHRQSLWNRIWTGMIIYKNVPSLTTPITLKPTGKGRKILFKAPSTNYHCMPNPIDIQPSQIIDNINNQTIIIN